MVKLLAVALVVIVALLLSCAPKGHKQMPLKPGAYRAETQ